MSRVQLLRRLSTKGIMSSRKRRLRPTVEVSTSEEALFDILRKTLQRFELRETVVRVAGGWVRDKLLGFESHDIDVAVNNCTGADFAAYVFRYLEDEGISSGNVGIILANPEQSKHLETAKLKVMEHEVDFVNLRSEEYDQGSRIPGMKFGTPLEDATRRDFTINSLFYNVNTCMVEDLTCTGLADLENGIIRTPLPAAETFRDDPLRILRALRFASRFGFQLDSEIEAGVKDKNVLQALDQKVSRERIGVEVVGMLEGANPLYALQALTQYGLVDIVFRLPDSSYDEAGVSPHKASQERMKRIANRAPIVDWGQEGVRLSKRLQKDIASNALDVKLADDISATLMYLSSMLFCLEQKIVISKKGKPESSQAVVIRSALKLKATLATDVAATCKGAEMIRQYIRDEPLESKNTNLRLLVGRLIRQNGKLWPLSMHVALASDAASKAAQYQELSKLIKDWHLSNLWQEKPLISGNDIMEKLKLERGPHIGSIAEKLWDWRILNPKGSVEEMELYLISKFSSLQFPKVGKSKDSRKLRRKRKKLPY